MNTPPGGSDWVEGGVPPADDHSGATTDDAAGALTCIRPAYTLASRGADAAEIDDLMVKNMITVLAEVAMAVASRMIAP